MSWVRLVNRWGDGGPIGHPGGGVADPSRDSRASRTHQLRQADSLLRRGTSPLLEVSSFATLSGPSRSTPSGSTGQCNVPVLVTPHYYFTGLNEQETKRLKAYSNKYIRSASYMALILFTEEGMPHGHLK